MQKFIHILTPNDLKSLIEEFAFKIVQEKFTELSLLVGCKGYLGNIEKTQYNKYYKVTLSYLGEYFYIDIPKAIVENLNLTNGMYVSATGILKANLYLNQLSFRLDIKDIELLDSPEILEQQRCEQVTLDNLKPLIQRHGFPNKKNWPWLVALIYPKSSQAQVQNDFLGTLHNFQKLLAIKHYPINIFSAEEICSAVLQAKADVLIIIRGGGESDQFNVFNDKSVLTTIANYSGYRICGLGHSGHQTLLDTVVDFSATTPTAAGYHLTEQISKSIASQKELRALRKQVKIWRLISKLLIPLFLILSAYSVWAYYHITSQNKSALSVANTKQNALPAKHKHKVRTFQREGDYEFIKPDNFDPGYEGNLPTLEKLFWY